MNTLGIYFGPEIISIVEAKGKKLINNIQVLQKNITAGEFEEKVPGEIKMVALFKDELRRNNIIAKEANVALSGKDLIIRTFEMPFIPRQDLAGAVNFESRKYIPFKAEELILDYQLYYDTVNRKNIVLLVGIKKETLDKYFAIFKELNLTIASMQYAAFSVLRLLKLAGSSDKGVIGLVDADLQEKDEVNFMVLESGFPLFSRDIILKGGPEEPYAATEIGSGTILEKFKTEIRISLDYYHRKFPLKKIDRIFFISGKDNQSDLEVFFKDLGRNVKFIDLDKCVGKAVPFSLSFLKGYSSALSRAIKIVPRIDLILAKARQEKETAASLKVGAPLLKNLHIEPITIIVSLVICIAAFVFGFLQRLPIEKKIIEIKAARPQVTTISPEATFEELNSRDSSYKKKLITLDSLIKEQLYLTLPLDVIPRVITKGVWLQNFAFRKKEEGEAELSLQGMAYLADSDKEFKAINDFFSKLKENPEFNKYFKEIRITSIEQGKLGKLAVTNFYIFCRSNKGNE